METIGQRIRKLRDIKAEEEGHCTQEELGKALDVSQNTIQKWEHDMVCLNSEKIIALADYFDVSCDYILRGGKPEHLKMMKATGLSDEAISLLVVEKEVTGQTIRAETINALIESPGLTEALHEYLFSDLRSLKADGQTIRAETITFSESFNHHGFIFDNFEPIARLAVMDYLQVARGAIHNGKP